METILILSYHRQAWVSFGMAARGNLGIYSKYRKSQSGNTGICVYAQYDVSGMYLSIHTVEFRLPYRSMQLSGVDLRSKM